MHVHKLLNILVEATKRRGRRRGNYCWSKLFFLMLALLNELWCSESDLIVWMNNMWDVPVCLFVWNFKSHFDIKGPLYQYFTVRTIVCEESSLLLHGRWSGSAVFKVWWVPCAYAMPLYLFIAYLLNIRISSVTGKLFFDFRSFNRNKFTRGQFNKESERICFHYIYDAWTCCEGLYRARWYRVPGQDKFFSIFLTNIYQISALCFAINVRLVIEPFTFRVECCTYYQERKRKKTQRNQKVWIIGNSEGMSRGREDNLKNRMKECPHFIL